MSMAGDARPTAARPRQKRRASAIALVFTAAFAIAGCTQAPSFENLEAIGGSSTGAGDFRPPAWTEDDSLPSRTLSGGPRRRADHTVLPEAENAQSARYRRLENRQRLIQGRVEAVDRQLDLIDARQHQRERLNPSLRYRTTGREVLLNQERRALAAEQRAVQRDLNALEFEQRIDGLSRDPLGSAPRLRSRSILSR